MDIVKEALQIPILSQYLRTKRLFVTESDVLSAISKLCQDFKDSCSISAVSTEDRELFLSFADRVIDQKRAEKAKCSLTQKMRYTFTCKRCGQIIVFSEASPTIKDIQSGLKLICSVCDGVKWKCGREQTCTGSRS